MVDGAPTKCFLIYTSVPKKLLLTLVKNLETLYLWSKQSSRKKLKKKSFSWDVCGFGTDIIVLGNMHTSTNIEIIISSVVFR